MNPPTLLIKYWRPLWFKDALTLLLLQPQKFKILRPQLCSFYNNIQKHAFLYANAHVSSEDTTTIQILKHNCCQTCTLCNYPPPPLWPQIYSHHVFEVVNNLLKAETLRLLHESRCFCSYIMSVKQHFNNTHLKLLQLCWISMSAFISPGFSSTCGKAENT